MTEHFEIHFAEQSRPEARRVAAVAERVYARFRDSEPRRRTQIELFNSGDSGIFLPPPGLGR